MVNINNPTQLQHEFDEELMLQNSYHGDMSFYLDAYHNNVYFPQKPNAPARTNKGVNLLQVFAEKLWHSLAEFPQINVPAVPGDRQNASIREKILYSTHQHNSSAVQWVEQGFDAAVLSSVITTVDWDFQQQCVIVKRVDPRFCFWKEADGVADEIEIFWHVKPLTKEKIKDLYGVTVTGSPIAFDLLQNFSISPKPGEEYYAVVTRSTDTTFVRWCGNKILVKPHAHGLGRNPAVVSFPIKIASETRGLKGDFYLRKLVDLQAEFNDYWRQRANVVRKLGNPTVYGKGIARGQFAAIKDSMSLDGGFVGLTENGDLGILSIPETQMIDNALADLFQRMKDAAGFPTATFGESVGANTSGDALGMYFQPTAKMVAAYTAPLARHLETVNSLILRYYDTRLPLLEQKQLFGTLQGGRYVRDESGEGQYQQGAFAQTFTKANINGQYHNVVTMPSVTPKDDIAHKRLWLDATREGVMSKTTFFDRVGFLSPEDELALLKEELGDPLLNSQGAAQLAQAANSMQQPTLPTQTGV